METIVSHTIGSVGNFTSTLAPAGGEGNDYLEGNEHNDSIAKKYNK